MLQPPLALLNAKTIIISIVLARTRIIIVVAAVIVPLFRHLRSIMGGGASAPSTVQHKLKKSEEEIVRLMMPVYYNDTVIDAKENKMALDSWNLILDDQSPVFRERRGNSDFPYHTCVTFFYDTFYTRFFDIHPTSRHMFKNGMRAQGKFLVKMISLSLSELDDPVQFDKNLVKLTEIHYERGVKSVECKFS